MNIPGPECGCETCRKYSWRITGPFATMTDSTGTRVVGGRIEPIDTPAALSDPIDGAPERRTNKKGKPDD